MIPKMMMCEEFGITFCLNNINQPAPVQSSQYLFSPNKTVHKGKNKKPYALLIKL